MSRSPSLFPYLQARHLVWPLLPFLVACGGGGSSPTGPTPTPSEPTYSVTVTVFYDENGNGRLDQAEIVRLPGVEVVIGAGTGTTGVGTGEALVTGIRAGEHNVALRTESLPTFYEPAAEFPIQVPGTTEAVYPVTLPIGGNFPNLYLGFGDSITFGDGSSDGEGYGLALQHMLGPHLGGAEVRLKGRPADTSIESSEVIRRDMRDFRPAYTLVLLGTNDWQVQTCQNNPPAECFTVEALRTILLEVKAWQSLPVLGTVPPVNPAVNPGRNDWIDELNVSLVALAREQGALLADINGAFKAEGDLPSLFDDDVHPNDAGYEVIGRAWFEAITRSRSAAASSRRRGFGFSFGG
jgi:lysophospholipase L1-like esterase